MCLRDGGIIFLSCTQSFFLYQHQLQGKVQSLPVSLLILKPAENNLSLALSRLSSHTRTLIPFHIYVKYRETVLAKDFEKAQVLVTSEYPFVVFL